MGLFGREKVCSFETAKKLLQKEKYKNHVAVPVDIEKGTYRLVLENKQELIYESATKNRQNRFKDEISGNGEYKNIQTRNNYNNYQNARWYKKHNLINQER